jgi:CheY-like chemotaxis protein/HPt (histidine-containing phosphotransfer) domain-containing protein
LPVLVVDDNATNRRILSDVVSSWKMEPHAVASGDEGLRAMRDAQQAKRPYAIVIVDGQMPAMDGFMFAGRVRRNKTLRGTPLIMLTSAARPTDAARCRTLKIAAHLTKPVKQSDLLDTMLTILGERVAAQTAAVDSLPRAAARRLRVLVAEDNQVNRRFVTRVLEKRGHSVSTVPTGRHAIEAIERLKPRSFDVVLMDVQMPELDGLSATERIRQAERSAGGHVPIVAMTAHAMAGDRDRCFAAGMDDYVTKPLHPHELVDAVERAVAPQRSARVAPGPAGSAPAFDMGRARARLGGDRQLLREMIAIFRAESPATMTAIRKSTTSGDISGLRESAHALKGSLGTLGALQAFQAAQRLEDVARQNDLAAIAPAFIDLEREMTELARALAPARRPGTVPKRKGTSHAITHRARKRPRRRR